MCVCMCICMCICCVYTMVTFSLSGPRLVFVFISIDGNLNVSSPPLVFVFVCEFISVVITL